MLVPRNAEERVHGHGAVGHREPVHLDGLADTGRFAELLGQAARGVGRDRRDLFSVFGRVLRDGVLENAERRAHRRSVHLEIAFERGLFDFVVGLRRVVGQIPVQRLVALRRVAHDALRGRINQRRPVRARGKELLVVQVVLVHQQVRHGERHRGIGSGANGHPLVGLLGRARHMRVEVHQFAAVRARVGEHLRRDAGAMARGHARLRAELHEVLAVRVVGKRVAATGQQSRNGMRGRSADIGLERDRMLPLLPSQFMESIHEMMLVISANTMTGLFFCFCSSSFSKMRSYASSS